MGCIPRIVSEDLNVNLMKLVSDAEIKRAAFSLGALNPRGDGLNGLLFQNHWEDIGKDICATIHCFFQDGSLLEEINETLVVLIPKIHKLENINEFRPISYYSFIYKIISKIIVLRLKKIHELLNFS